MNDVQRIQKGLQYLGYDAESVVFEKADCFYTETENGRKKVYYKELCDCYRGLYFSQEKTRKQSFERLGYLLDCSRGAVVKVEKVKEWIATLACFGYNRLLLYTEDTYEIESERYFGYKRGRYSMEEMSEIAAFAADFGVEIVPHIQTLAHLLQMLLWKEYNAVHDSFDVIKIGEEKTYELIEKMVASVKKAYGCKTLHIGFDEAFCVGTGNRAKSMADMQKSEMISYHLERILSICDKYDLKLLLWHDMIVEHKLQLDERVQPVCWEYFSTDDNYYASLLSDTEKYCKEKPAFAGAVLKWNNLMPDNTFSIAQAKRIFNVYLQQGVKDFYLAGWGDNGAECSHFAGLPTVAYYAQRKYGFDEVDERAFQAITGVDYTDFFLLDKLNRILPEMVETDKNNYAKVLFYNDVFLGIYNEFAVDGLNVRYGALAKELQGKNFGKLQYMFDTAATLADVLSLKAELPVQLKKAYQAGDRETLVRLVDVMRAVAKKTDTIYQVYNRQWNEENKSYGSEIYDIRLGGLIARTNRCASILAAYLDGKVDEIAELKEEHLKFDPHAEYKPYDYISYPWGNIVSACLL